MSFVSAPLRKAIQDDDLAVFRNILPHADSIDIEDCFSFACNVANIRIIEEFIGNKLLGMALLESVLDKFLFLADSEEDGAVIEVLVREPRISIEKLRVSETKACSEIKEIIATELKRREHVKNFCALLNKRRAALELT